jgi:hypothetical protein
MTRTSLARLAFLTVALAACGAEDISFDPVMVRDDGTSTLDAELPPDETAPPTQDATVDAAPEEDVSIADVSVVDAVADGNVVDVTEPDVAPPKDAGPDVIHDAAPDVTVKDVNVPDVTVPPDADDHGDAGEVEEEAEHGGGGGGGGGPGPSGGG